MPQSEPHVSTGDKDSWMLVVTIPAVNNPEMSILIRPISNTDCYHTIFGDTS